MTKTWPQLDYLGWRDTCSALHLYLQIAGKYRLAHSPWLNHSWNATFYVTRAAWLPRRFPTARASRSCSIFWTTRSWAPAAMAASRPSPSSR